MYGNNIISGACCSFQHSHRPANFYPIWKPPASMSGCTTAVSLYQLVIFHFLIGIFCYMGPRVELSYRLGMRPWICVAYSAPVGLPSACLPDLPLRQGSFSGWQCPPAASPAPSLHVGVQAEHNILDATPSTCWVWLVSFGGSPCSRPCTVHSSPAALVRENDRKAESRTNGYKFGQEEETYNNRGGPRLLRSSESSSTPFSKQPQPALPARHLPVVGICSPPLAWHDWPFNLQRFQLQSVDPRCQGRVNQQPGPERATRAGLGHGR